MSLRWILAFVVTMAFAMGCGEDKAEESDTSGGVGRWRNGDGVFAGGRRANDADALSRAGARGFGK